MNYEARALGLPATMMLLALALPLKLALAAPAQDHTVDVDGVWGISDQGTDGEGANCDRWATGPAGSPSAISDTDPAIQNQAKKDENQVRYGLRTSARILRASSPTLRTSRRAENG